MESSGIDMHHHQHHQQHDHHQHDHHHHHLHQHHHHHNPAPAPGAESPDAPDPNRGAYSAEDGTWDGEKYWSYPGLQEMAQQSAEGVRWALNRAGVTHLSRLNVLEIGCGAGAVTPHFAKTFASVHSIDTSTSMLLSFNAHLPPDLINVTYSLHALSASSAASFDSASQKPAPTRAEPKRTAIPPRKRFDVGIANMVLHHVDDIPGFMAGVYGILESGGWFVISEFGSPPTAGSKTSDDPHDSKRNEHGTVNAADHYHRFTDKSIVKIFEDAGLINVKTEIKGTVPIKMEGKDPIPWLFAWGQKP